VDLEQILIHTNVQLNALAKQAAHFDHGKLVGEVRENVFKGVFGMT